MCKKSQNNAKVLSDRTKGLDSRGNVAVNTQAESIWATETLAGLNDESVAALKTDLKRVYDGTINAGVVTKAASAKFHAGYVKFLGVNGDLDPDPRDMVTLMLDTKYDFKEAVDALNRDQKSANKKLWEQCRKREEFEDRGRIQGRQRRNSFLNVHAGITDHVFRPEQTENFFDVEVAHAKGMLQGDPSSKTYNRFVKQGAPFIGGVSGTMQGLAMGWEGDEPLAEIEPEGARTTERMRREKLAGIHMATLLAGGHHSASELLFSAQSYGLFPDVADPLKNYPLAMKQLGLRFAGLGLSGSLSPQAGASWKKATKAVRDSLHALHAEISAVYRSEDDVAALIARFEEDCVDVVNAYFSDAVADKLDEITNLVDEDRREDRVKAVEELQVLLAVVEKNLDERVISGLDENPFLPLTIRTTMSRALHEASSLAR
jgi:hypothetical protein